jgi:predicted cupin superfamily sugar epimerase
LTSDAFSAFHRIRQDEIWHFYDGSPIALHTIKQDGVYTKTIIGRDFDLGQVPQFVVPGGSWFAAMVINPDDYSLIGCTVSPGFDFRDFELPSRNDLISKFPQHKEIISKLTRE